MVGSACHFAMISEEIKKTEHYMLVETWNFKQKDGKLLKSLRNMQYAIKLLFCILGNHDVIQKHIC